jgi:hypothetical protein
MTCETEGARVWAALLGLALLIAATLTVGYWLTVYHRDAREMEAVLGEDYSTIDMIWDDLPQVPLY